MRKMNKEKRGELTTAQLVTIIVLIASFVIILSLFFRLDLGKTSDQEICHNSVVLKGQTKIVSGPLDCKTNYLCISANSDCTDFSASEVVKVSTDTEKIKDETMKAIADAMSSCWYEFGEGEIDYASGSVFGNKACAVCSIVNLDNSLKDVSISYDEFYNYLKTTKKTDSQTYLQYLYSTNNIGDFNNFYLTNYLSNNLDPNKEYFILTGISKKAVWGLFGKANPIPITIMEKTSDNYNLIGCDQFLTKA